jgi:predicted Holliday junction resolvase-like endonuclease
MQKGKLGEKIAKDDYRKHGYKIIKTGIGSDFIALKNFDGSEKPLREFVEVKTGKARTTKKQKSSMRKIKKSGKTYTIYRVTDAFLDHYIQSNPKLQKGDLHHAL